MEARARIAMAKGALKRLVDPSFPPELRLQVMKAGVPYGTSCWRPGRFRTIDDLKNAAFSSLFHPKLWDHKKLRFNQSWLDSEARSILANTAEQAFLEAAIFEINATFSP